MEEKLRRSNLVFRQFEGIRWSAGNAVILTSASRCFVVSLLAMTPFSIVTQTRRRESIGVLRLFKSMNRSIHVIVIAFTGFYME